MQYIFISLSSFLSCRKILAPKFVKFLSRIISLLLLLYMLMAFVCLSFLEDIVPHFCIFFTFQFGSYKWSFNHSEIIAIDEDEAIKGGKLTVVSNTWMLCGSHAFLHNRFKSSTFDSTCSSLP